jgi:hypothetical protein
MKLFGFFYFLVVQGFELRALYSASTWATHPALFALRIFQIGSRFHAGAFLDLIPLIYTSHLAGMTDMYHHAQLSSDGFLGTFLQGWFRTAVLISASWVTRWATTPWERGILLSNLLTYSVKKFECHLPVGAEVTRWLEPGACGSHLQS